VWPLCPVYAQSVLLFSYQQEHPLAEFFRLNGIDIALLNQRRDLVACDEQREVQILLGWLQKIRFPAIIDEKPFRYIYSVT